MFELIEGGTSGIVRRGTGAIERLLQHPDVARAPGRPGIGAVDWKGHQEAPQSIGRHRLIETADRACPTRQDGELAREQLGQNLPLGSPDDRAEILRRSDEALGNRGQRIEARTSDEHAQDLVHELVAGGAGHRPILRQALLTDQDLLHPDVEWCRIGSDLRQPALQPVEIGFGIGEAVDMIDAQALDHAATGQAEDQCMAGFEYLRIVHAQAGELINVEEAAVIPAYGTFAPVDRAIRLLVQDLAHASSRIGALRERKPLVEVREQGLARLLHNSQLATRQNLVDRRAEDGQDQLAVGIGIEVDVEVMGIPAGAATAQHVPPPGVRPADAHVVGHDVEDQAEPVLVERPVEQHEAFLAAELGIEPGRIDDIVAVGRSRRCRERRRQINVAHPQSPQIGRQGRRAREIHVAAELQSVGGAWRGGHRVSHARSGPRPPTRVADRR